MMSICTQPDLEELLNLKANSSGTTDVLTCFDSVIPLFGALPRCLGFLFEGIRIKLLADSEN